MRQLSQIKAHLDLILLALEALTEISSETMLKAPVDLKLNDILSDRLPKIKFSMSKVKFLRFKVKRSRSKVMD